MAARKQRIDAQPAFILHQYPYRETSRLLEVFSRDYGRIAVVARGAQRPASQLRAVLLGFQPVLLSWFGEREVRTLHAAEWQGGVAQLQGLPLLCGFYLNELLLRFLARDDPHPDLFSVYYATVCRLATLDADGEGVEPILRDFERDLLMATGYGVDWTKETQSQQPVQASLFYSFQPGLGIVSAQAGFPCYDGATLLAFAAGRYENERVQSQTKLLMRQAFAALQGDAPLHTRQLLLELQKL